jgi:hypothetical protein
MSREWQNTAGRLRQRRGRRQIGQHLIVSLPRELLLSRDLLHYGVPSVLRTNSSFGPRAISLWAPPVTGSQTATTSMGQRLDWNGCRPSTGDRLVPNSCGSVGQNQIGAAASSPMFMVRVLAAVERCDPATRFTGIKTAARRPHLVRPP